MKLNKELLDEIIDGSLDYLFVEQTEQEIEKAKKDAAKAQMDASSAAVKAAEKKSDVSDLEAEKAEKEAESLSLESLLETTMQEALADFEPSEREKLKDLAISIIRKAKESPEFEGLQMPPNAAGMAWEAAFRAHRVVKQEKQNQIEKQANLFIDQVANIQGRSEIEKNVGKIEESFQIKKSRLRQIVAEEVASAKKQGIL